MNSKILIDNSSTSLLFNIIFGKTYCCKHQVFDLITKLIHIKDGFLQYGQLDNVNHQRMTIATIDMLYITTVGSICVTMVTS